MPPRAKGSSTPATPPELDVKGPWLLLIYRVPSTDSSRARVAVWRDLKRLGALYLQQAVCVLPDHTDLRESVAKLCDRIADLGGTSFFITLTDVEDDIGKRFIDGFRVNSAKEYDEIIEECETKFFKEIEFERFRGNYTFEEAEEINQDLEKLRRWLTKVEGRDWAHAEGKALARAKVDECEVLLDQFETDIYEKLGTE